MSISSTVKSLFSTATSAVSASTSLNVYIAIGVLVAALAGSAWLYVSGLKSTISTQQGTITAQSTTITKQAGNIDMITADRDEAINQRDQAQNRTRQLNAESIKNENARRQAEQEAKTLAEQIAKGQAGDKCAKHPVPEPVKRLQQQAVNEFNAKYGGAPGNPTSKAVTSGNVSAP